MRINESTPRSEAFISVDVSGDVRAALRLCLQNSTGATSVVNDADVLYAITSLRNRANSVISTMFLENSDRFISYLHKQSGSQTNRQAIGICEVEKGAQFQISVHAAELFVLAVRRAQNEHRSVTTDDFLLADLDREHSLIRNISGQLGMDGELSDMMIREVSRQTRTLEYSDSKPIRYVTSIPVVPKVIEPGMGFASASELRQVNRPPTVNWTELARTNNLGETVSRPDLVRRIISSIHGAPVTVLVSEQSDEAQDLIRNVAHELAQTNGSLSYSDIHIIDQISLTATPQSAAVRAITAATGGTLYLPDADQYLDQSSDVSAPLMTALQKGLIRVITVLPRDDWNRVSRTFPFRKAKEIIIHPMNPNEKRQFLLYQRSAIQESFSSAAQIRITDEAIGTAIRLCGRYYTGGEVDLIRRAAMNVSLETTASATIRNPKTKNDGSVDPDDIVLALFEARGIVVNPDDPEKYTHMEEALGKIVIGQEEAIAIVSKAIRRSVVGLNDPNKPRGRFMFFGPTGVGKTELAKALTQFLFDDRSALISLDMSEYMEKHTVARLTGAPPGYVGYEEGGHLTEQVKQRPYSVVLFDEVEKAHPDVMNLFLQILEEGRLTDGRGQVVDFRQCVIIMTGNVGTEYYRIADKIGRDKLVQAVQGAVQSTFRPEFLNRLDATVIFNQLGLAQIGTIADIKIAQLNARLQDQHHIQVQLTAEAKEYLVAKAFVPELGARELERVLNDQLADPLATEILSSGLSSGKTIEVYLKDGVLKFRPIKSL